MRSVRTTLNILDAVADHQPIGLSDLARRLELPKSTVQRSLVTLADLGWIRPETGEQPRWRLGDRARQLADKVDDVSRLREIALPILSRLNDETSETIHLAVPDGSSMRLVERLDSKHPLRLVRAIGNSSPMHATSTGKAHLAQLSDASIEQYLRAPLERITPHTITNADTLRAELSTIRKRGYALASEELVEGTSSVAASIRSDDRPIASISVSGASLRFPPSVCRRYATLVRQAAAAVEEALTS